MILYLYHVTRQENVPSILENGLSRYAAASESVDEEDAEVRMVFNEYLPLHNSSVFMWSDVNVAEAMREHMSQLTGDDYAIIEINALKIPCKCYYGDSSLAEELFDLIDSNAMEFVMISSEGVMDERDAELDAEARELAERYIKSLTEINFRTAEPDPTKEVICPCDVPVDAIVRAY